MGWGDEHLVTQPDVFVIPPKYAQTEPPASS